MKQNKGEHIFNFFWICFFILIIGTAVSYNAKARLIPLLVAGICLVMSLSVFIGGILKKDGKGGLSGEDALLEGIMKKVDVTAGDEHKKEKLSPAEQKKRFFDAVFWILGFVLIIFLVGFLIAIPAYTLLFMRTKKESWVLSASCAAGLWLSVYVAFVMVSKSTLYEGIIFRMLGGE